MWDKFELDSTVLKVPQDVRLWQSEKGIVDIKADALAILVKRDGEKRGYVFHGQGKLVLDTIVETDEGALGRSIEKELNKPFLMLTRTEDLQAKLSEASDDDLKRMGYENLHSFADAASESLDRFLGRQSFIHEHSRNRGFVFAFPSDDDKLDVLVADDDKLVYRSADITFISEAGKTVLKGPHGMICSGNGKSVVIKRGNFIVCKDCAAKTSVST
jgi:hypothetical protein